MEILYRHVRDDFLLRIHVDYKHRSGSTLHNKVLVSMSDHMKHTLAVFAGTILFCMTIACASWVVGYWFGKGINDALDVRVHVVN